MLRFMAFCLATGLASTSQDTPPVFSNVYTVDVEYTETFSETSNIVPYKKWFDDAQNKGRMDVFGGTRQLLVVNPNPDNKNGDLVTVELMTTDDLLVSRYCHRDKPNSDRFRYIYERFKFSLDDFKFIGNEEIRGINAEKWEKSFIGRCGFTHNLTKWVAVEQQGNARQAVPVRFMDVTIDRDGGIIRSHSIADYYNYSTSAIDPKIFDFYKVWVCISPLANESKQTQSYMDDRIGTTLGHETWLARFMALHGNHANHEQKNRQEIFRRNLEYIEAHNRLGRGFKLAVNHLADRTDDELAKLRGRIPSNNTPPQFSNVYTVDVEHTELTSDSAIVTPYKVWFDDTQNKARLDVFGGMSQQMVVNPNPDNKKGDLVGVIPITTEVELNMRYCVHVPPDPGHFHFVYEDYRFSTLDDFKFVGNEEIRGINVEKWVKSGINWRGHQNLTKWVAVKQQGNARQAVPVRFMAVSIDTDRGMILSHSIVDYYNYSTSAIDPKIFDFYKDLRCLTSHANESKQTQSFMDRIGATLGHETWLARFMALHGNQANHEQRERQEIFRRNLEYIEAHNHLGRGFKLAVNHLADRTDDELAKLRGRIPTNEPSNALPFPYSDAEVEALSKDLPEQFDWRQHGAVTPVKDQMMCGSCWAYGAVGAVEGALFLHQNRSNLDTLSEQVLVDCSWGFKNSGCNGGLPASAYDWIKKHGLPTSADYGNYLSQDGYCHIDNVTIATKISAYYQIKPNDTNALKLAIFKHGPVDVGIDASGYEFRFYSNGVYRDPHCSSIALDHAVLCVGWGVFEGQPYWLLKNSWSTQWGMDGYMMMSSENNMCGVETNAHYVLI